MHIVDPRVTRRNLLQTGVGLLSLAAFGDLALAQEGVQLTPVGAMVKGKAKNGPYRIAFSNGFSGNSWRAMCIAALQAEAAKTPDIKEFVIVDGQGDINKQVNDIEGLINQQHDAILIIANSGAAVPPMVKQATDEGIVTAPFNLPIDGEASSTYVGTDPEKKGATLGKWLSDALGGKGKIVALGGLPGNSYGWAGKALRPPCLKTSKSLPSRMPIGKKIVPKSSWRISLPPIRRSTAYGAMVPKWALVR